MISALERPPRIASVDALRGLVMVIMALDHVRDFTHAGAMAFNPEDLSKTTPILFLTRWVTHICAPTFVFLAGVGVWFRLAKAGGLHDRAARATTSRYLLTRGLWLIVLELTVMRLLFNFSFDSRYPVLLLVLWALGASMIVLAALMHLPYRALALVSIAVVVLHNTLDGLGPEAFGALSGLWKVLHVPGVVILGGMPFVTGYPLLPWIALMGAGFCFGRVFDLDAAPRRRLLVGMGSAAVVLFVMLRAVNVYGDPQPWSPQPSPALTLLSFLRATKYPPSLQFLLMTIGPALLCLAWFDRRSWPRDHPLTVFGRVPLFYFVVHFGLAHLSATALAWWRYGAASFAWVFSPLPSMGGARELFPADFGYSLTVTYLVWIAIVIALYPMCRWFARVKATSRGWWVSYL